MTENSDLFKKKRNVLASLGIIGSSRSNDSDKVPLSCSLSRSRSVLQDLPCLRLPAGFLTTWGTGHRAASVPATSTGSIYHRKDSTSSCGVTFPPLRQSPKPEGWCPVTGPAWIMCPPLRVEGMGGHKGYSSSPH